MVLYRLYRFYRFYSVVYTLKQCYQLVYNLCKYHIIYSCIHMVFTWYSHGIHSCIHLRAVHLAAVGYDVEDVDGAKSTVDHILPPRRMVLHLHHLVGHTRLLYTTEWAVVFTVFTVAVTVAARSVSPSPTSTPPSTPPSAAPSAAPSPLWRLGDFPNIAPDQPHHLLAFAHVL